MLCLTLKENDFVHIQTPDGEITIEIPWNERRGRLKVHAPTSFRITRRNKQALPPQEGQASSMGTIPVPSTQLPDLEPDHAA
jgi:hypothetical protein